MRSSTASMMDPAKPILVNIGTHSLAVYAHGQEPKNSEDPVVLFISGVASSRLVWAGVTRLLPPNLRSYTYDRSGFGNSELSPLTPTAENIALELSRLVKIAPIENPLIIVAHSWAGVLVSELIALKETGSNVRVAGLVLVDANHETKLTVLNPNNANLRAVAEGLDQYSAKGIDVEHKLTAEEWDAFVSDEATEKHELQSQKEDTEYAPSFSTLLKKELAKRQPLLGDTPVYVIGGTRSRDWGRLYEAGVARGNGTAEQRRMARELIRTADDKSAGLMREWLKLSTRGKLVFATESGHFVQLTQPDVVVDGVTWVLTELQSSKSS